MTRKVQLLDFVALVALSLMWSSSFLFIKISVETLTPMTVAASRMLIAAVLLYLIMKMKGLSLPRDSKSWLFFLAIGLIGNAVPFYLISWAELTIDSSIASILIASAPLAAFMIGHVVTTDEKLNFSRFIGVIIGFIGIIVLIGPGAILNLGVNALSQIAVIVGAICYVSASFIARHMPPMEPLPRAAGVLIVASLIAVPMALILDEPWNLTPSMDSLLAVGVLGVFPTAIATLILFFLVMRAGATFVALNNYINPVLGVVWGYFFMAEYPVSQTYLGLGLILGGLILTQITFPGLGKNKKS